MEFKRNFTRSTIAAATFLALSLPVAANEAASARADAANAPTTQPPVANQYGTPSTSMPGSATDSARPSIGPNHGQAVTPPSSEATAPSVSAQAPLSTPERDLGMQGRSASDAGKLLADSSQVREVQQKLKAEGHNPGKIDGIMGPRTEAALKSFQQAKGIEASGEIDPRTLSALKLSMEGQSATTASVGSPKASKPHASAKQMPSNPASQPQASASPATSTDSTQSQASTTLGTSTDSPKSQANVSSDTSQAGGSQSSTGMTGQTGDASKSKSGSAS